MRQPNILLFTTDQQRWDGWGLMNAEVKTPNLDKVFRGGVRFSGAVCQVPMCIPSRYSYMTGLYPSQVGSRLNAQTWQDPAQMPAKVLAEYLMRDGGYFTIGCGKTHYTMGADKARGIPQAVPTNRGFMRRAWSGVRGSGEAGLGARFWPEEDPEAREYFMKVEKEGSAPFPAGGEGLAGYKGSSWPFGLERTREGWATRCAIDFLEEAQSVGDPWFLNLSYDLPHAPFCTIGEFEALYDGEDIAVPEEPPAGIVEHWGTFKNTANFLEHWRTLDQAGKRAIIVKYHALCSMVDHLFGQVIDFLEKSGELSNTWILFCSDHGESLGDRGRFSKYTLYESSVRVPLAIAGPEVPPTLAGREVKAPVELVDIVPTVLKLAGIDVPASLPGRDLLSGKYRSGSFAEMHGTGAEDRQAAPVYMWRTQQWKLILRLPGTLRQAAEGEADWEGELYDLESDPGELRNLYQDSRYRDLREKLTLALLRQLACANARYPYPDTLPRI